MNDLIKIDVDGNPYVSSQTISDEFGREHKNVLNSIRDLISSGHINRLDFKLIHTPGARGGTVFVCAILYRRSPHPRRRWGAGEFVSSFTLLSTVHGAT